jgi:hypothetical protein
VERVPAVVVAPLMEAITNTGDDPAASFKSASLVEPGKIYIRLPS